MLRMWSIVQQCWGYGNIEMNLGNNCCRFFLNTSKGKVLGSVSFINSISHGVKMGPWSYYFQPQACESFFILDLNFYKNHFLLN